MNIVNKISTSATGPARKGPVVAVIVHATGDTDLDEVASYYLKPKKAGYRIGPHYLIDTAGAVYQFTPEDCVAYHAGYQGDGDDNDGALYKQGWAVWSRRIKKAPWIVQGEFSGYAWWRERWPGLESPTGLWVDGRQVSPGLVCGEHPNGSTVGIECLSPKHRLPEVFTDAQYASLSTLVREIAGRHGFPVDKDRIIGHEDVGPIARCDEKGGWDPGLSRGFNWGRVLD